MPQRLLDISTAINDFLYKHIKRFCTRTRFEERDGKGNTKAHYFEVPSQVGTGEMAEMEEMVRKGTEENQAKWDLRVLLEKKVKRSKQGDPFGIRRATSFPGPLPWFNKGPGNEVVRRDVIFCHFGPTKD